MQKQPKFPYPIKIEEYPLDMTFPLHYFSYSPKNTDISSVHTHNFLEIGYCYDGVGIFVIDNVIHSFSAGDIFVIFKNQLHKAQSLERPSKWHFLYVNAEHLLRDYPLHDLLLLSECSSSECRNVVHAPKSEELMHIFKNLMSEIQDSKDGYQAAVRSIVCYFLVKFKRASGKPDTTHQYERRSSRILRLSPALQYISESYMNEIEIKDLADQCAMSLTSLRREFAAVIGMTPLHYIATMRVKTAIVLLKSTRRTISEIAGEVGFQSLSSFNRTFKTIVGTSPREYINSV